ncbi:MAG TPA: FlgD immunoglobulin-like domain containing protein, partial [bacterium]
LPIKFKISSDRLVRLEIYDITGTRISRLTESQFNAGWNTYRWDGLTENGQKIGSGFYILTIHSGEYSAWKKLIIVR